MTPREIDALVAEKVMGCYIKYYENAFPPYQQVSECGCRPRQHGDVLNLPPYSTDIAAAWEVVERLQEHAFGVELSNMDTITHQWEVTVYWRGSRKADYDPEIRGSAEAATPSMAICLAALKAVSVEVPA